MIYEESTKHNKTYIILAIAFLAILFAPVLLDMQELFSDEGRYLAAVREMDQYPPLMRTQGDIGNGGYPFYPLLVRLLVNAGIPMIISLRLIRNRQMQGIRRREMIIGIPASTRRRTRSG